MDEKQATIMIVDDVPANLRLLNDILEAKGYFVRVFSHGSSALRAAAKSLPDLILLDVNMPDMNGYEVCERLKADDKLKDIPVIFISALSETAEIVHAFQVGGVDYITKPFQFEEVQSRVATHLKLCAALRELEKQNLILQENMRLREFVEQITRHDLKAPLNVFFNIPEMVLDEGGLSTFQVECLSLLPKAAQQMLHMIQNSLDLYKMERGTYRVVPVAVNVLKTLRDVLRALAGPINAKELSCVIRLDGKTADENDVFDLPGEPLLFFSLFSNLIKNAVEASPDGMEITITLTASPIPEIAINNRGAIPPEIRDRFFERYATFGKAQGTGLGAFSARLIARTLGGELSFTTGEIEGTTLVLAMEPVGARQR